MRPALGRFFRPDEDRVPDRDRVAVIGYDFWQSWFARQSRGARIVDDDQRRRTSRSSVSRRRSPSP